MVPQCMSDLKGVGHLGAAAAPAHPAAASQGRLRFDYRGHEGEDSRRTVEPHRLVFTGRRWYLVAWDRDREDWRTFRADRIQPRLPTGPRFTPREPPEDVVSHVIRGTSSTAWPHPARVRLHVSAEVIGERIPPAPGLLHPEGEQSCVLETGSGSLRDLAGFLVSLDVGFEVLDPPELRALLRELADRCRVAARPD